MFKQVRDRGTHFLQQYPRQRLWWSLASRLMVFTVGQLSKGYLRFRHRVTVENWDVLTEALRQSKLEKRGLLTVMNHVSILDDPLIWGLMPSHMYLSEDTTRWTLGADDICFRNPVESLVFSLGQTLPVRRFGSGPYQPGLDAAVTLLSNGQWLHIYPEGFVHQPMEPHARTLRYFHWGVSRLILETDPSPPIVVPIFGTGLDAVFPEDKPKRLFGYGSDMPISYKVGSPLDFEAISGFRDSWRDLTSNSDHEGYVPLDIQLRSKHLRSKVANYVRAGVHRLSKLPDDIRFSDPNFWQTEAIPTRSRRRDRELDRLRERQRVGDSAEPVSPKK